MSGWEPEPTQGGAGEYPGAEPEMAALLRWMHDTPTLFGVLGYHSGVLCLLHSPADPAGIADQGDDTLIKTVAKKGEKILGMDAVPPFKLHGAGPGSRDEQCKSRGAFLVCVAARLTLSRTPDHGDPFDFFYQHLGLMGWEIETGAAINSAGQTSADFFASGSGDEDGAEESARWRRELLRWMDDGHAGAAPLWEPWSEFEHPQLGLVEIGGFHSAAASNPVISGAEFPELLDKFHEFTELAARMAPRLVCAVEEVARLVQADSEACWRVRLKVTNRGELPTNLTNRGRTLGRRCPPVVATFVPAEGATLASSDAEIEVGALSGVTGSAELEWFVLGGGGVLGEVRVDGGVAGAQVVRVAEEP